MEGKQRKSGRALAAELPATERRIAGRSQVSWLSRAVSSSEEGEEWLLRRLSQQDGAPVQTSRRRNMAQVAYKTLSGIASELMHAHVLVRRRWTSLRDL